MGKAQRKVVKIQREAASRRAVAVGESPGVAVACYAGMPADAFGTAYRSPTHAMHLYEYDATLRLAGRDLPLQRGSVSFTPAGEESRYRVPRAGRHWCVHFAAEAEGRPAEQPLDLPLVWDASDLAPEARSRFERLVVLAAARPAEGSDALLDRSLGVTTLELVLWLARESAARRDVQGGAADAVGVHPAVARLVSVIQRDLHRPL